VPAAAQEVRADPIVCWWRSSAGAVRAGEPFSVVLTCAVVENDAAKVVVDQAKLEPSVVQFPPFEVIPSGSSHGPDLRTEARRFFQYEYRLRLVTENLFGKDVALPETKLSYHVQSQVTQGAAIQGRDQSFVLPPLSIRVLSLVPADAADIRDATSETFTDLDQRAFRASVLVVTGGILYTLAGLTALLALVRVVARYRKTSTATGPLVSNGSILRAAGAELSAIERTREGRGWTPELIARALSTLRIVSAFALGRKVSLRQSSVANDVRDGQLSVRTGWPPRKRVFVSASITPQAVAHQIARGSSSPKRAVMLEALEQALTRFTAAVYGRDGVVDDRALDDSLAAVARALTRLKIDQIWIMKRLSRERVAPEVESRAWSR